MVHWITSINDILDDFFEMLIVVLIEDDVRLIVLFMSLIEACMFTDICKCISREHRSIGTDVYSISELLGKLKKGEKFWKQSWFSSSEVHIIKAFFCSIHEYCFYLKFCQWSMSIFPHTFALTTKYTCMVACRCHMKVEGFMIHKLYSLKKEYIFHEMIFYNKFISS